MLARIYELELRHFPPIASMDEETVHRQVDRLAATFFTRETIKYHGEPRLWCLRNSFPPLENSLSWESKPLGVYAVRRLRGLRSVMGERITIFFQDLNWICCETDLSSALSYLKELRDAHREIYIVSENWYRCLTITHDSSLWLLRPLDLTPRAKVLGR